MNVYYILRTKDIHGDTYPLTTRLQGIDGVQYASLEQAKVTATRYSADKAFRTSMRERNQWTKDTITGLQIDEVKAS